MNKLNSKWAFLILNAKSVAAFKPLSSRLTKTWARMSSCKKNQMFNRVCNYSYGVIQALAYSGDRHSKLACSAGVFWTAKTACSCSCCCSRYLWFYDSGRLGRVEVATLREPLGWVLTRPFPPLFSSLKRVLSRTKTSARPRKERLYCRLIQNSHIN